MGDEVHLVAVASSVRYAGWATAVQTCYLPIKGVRESKSDMPTTIICASQGGMTP